MTGDEFETLRMLLDATADNGSVYAPWSAWQPDPKDWNAGRHGPRASRQLQPDEVPDPKLVRRLELAGHAEGTGPIFRYRLTPDGVAWATETINNHQQKDVNQ